MKINEKRCILSSDCPVCILSTCHKSTNRLYIEVTSECNSSCIHCFNASNNCIRELALSEVDELCALLSNMSNIESVILSGGEAALHPKFKDIVLMLLPYANIQVLSNGKTLDDELINFLIHNNIHIQITLNGTNKSVDEQIRGDGFEKTVEAIKHFDALHASSLLNITMTLCKQNYHQIEEMAEFSCKMHINKLIYSFVYKKGRAVVNWEDLKLTIPEKIDCLIRVAKLQSQYFSRLDIRTSAFKQLARALEQVEPEENYSCSDLAETISIDNNLNVHLCSQIDRYLTCQSIKPVQLRDLLNHQIVVPLQLKDDKCYDCNAKTACIVGCLNII